MPGSAPEVRTDGKILSSAQQILPPDEPWREIPAPIGRLLEPHLPALSDEIIAAIREAVPAYRRPLRGRFGAGIRRGVEEALGQFVDLIADPELDRSATERVYGGLGRGEYRERRSLDALLDAYRLGARVAWRRVAALAIEARVDRRTLALLAEAVFAYIDRLAALSAEGYAEEQSAQAGETQRRRRRLARLLLDPGTIRRRSRRRPRRSAGSRRRAWRSCAGRPAPGGFAPGFPSTRSSSKRTRAPARARRSSATRRRPASPRPWRGRRRARRWCSDRPSPSRPRPRARRGRRRCSSWSPPGRSPQRACCGPRITSPTSSPTPSRTRSVSSPPAGWRRSSRRRRLARAPHGDASLLARPPG